MGTLVLVRHGQASFLAADYDKLSPLGERQARLLGEHWARCGVRVARAFCGPRARQRRTAELAAEAMAEGGAPWPALVALEGLDEIRLDGMVAAALPSLAEREPELAGLVGDFGAIAEGRGPSPQFERRIARVFHLWITGAADAPGVEPWDAFRARVRDALAAMREGADKGARVVGFTSAGTISAALQLALRTDAATTAELMWRVRNSSATEFLFSADRFGLAAFNGTPHLEDGALITYR
jgi:broad specificity phosphatase PhoE